MRERPRDRPDEVGVVHAEYPRASAPAGLVSGPSTLKIVRIPSSLRGPMTAFIAGWKTGASMNPIPSVSIASSTAGGSASTSAPATSSTSALPDEEDTE